MTPGFGTQCQRPKLKLILLISIFRENNFLHSRGTQQEGCAEPRASSFSSKVFFLIMERLNLSSHVAFHSNTSTMLLDDVWALSP